MLSRFGLSLGEQVPVPDPAVSARAAVVGIDHYTARTVSGGVSRWISYTLHSRLPPESRWHRFWAVDGQVPDGGAALVRRSFYVASGAAGPPAGFALDRDMSGYVELRSDGDAALSGGAVARGALLTYRAPDGRLWAEEVFAGAGRLAFDVLFEDGGR